MKKFGLLWAAACLITAAATACGGTSTSSPPTSGSGTATPSAATITIASMSYGEPVTVPPGAQIAVANNDSVEHSVTSDASGTFTVDVDSNDKATFTAPSTPGAYPFHCKYHPAMHGTLTVT